MRNGVEKLRIWLAAGAGVLLLVVAGFLVFAHYRSMLFKARLPGKLGVNITREANGYTWSQTVEGRTVFTLHAAKLEQRKDGLVQLHDVGIVLYGRKQDRTDRIYGKEFEYDQAAGIVRGVGEVHMDLQAPSPAAGDARAKRAAATGDGGEPGGDTKMIHVLTSGLVYLEKLGVAATSEDIEFAEGAMKGWAHGADYNSDSGLLVLQSAVRMNGLTAGGPMTMTANHAQWNKEEQRVDLVQAKTVTTSETVEAGQAVIHMTEDGTLQRMEAGRGVKVTRLEGGVLTAERGDVLFGPNGKASDAQFGGGVTYVDEEAARHARGQSAQAHVVFDGQGLAEQVVMTGGAELEVRERGTASEAWSTRDVTGDKVDVALVAAGPSLGRAGSSWGRAGSSLGGAGSSLGGAGSSLGGAGSSLGGAGPSLGTAGPALGRKESAKREIRDAEAVGSAKVLVVNEATGKTAGGATRTEMSGDDLKAHFLSGNRMASVAGMGHTVLHQVNGAGLDEVSSGDATDLVFRPVAAKAGKAPAGKVAGVQTGTEELVTAVQTGHVVTLRKRMQMQNAVMVPVTERSTAEKAVYDADANRVTLTGGVVLTNVANTLWGERVVIERGSGNATAEGGVRVNYAQPGKDGQDGEPVHVMADRAELKRGVLPVAAGPANAVKGAKRSSDDTTFFYGSGGKLARLWQGTSQVQAPVLEFEEGVKRLTASGPSEGMVHTVLVSSAGAAGGAPASGGGTPEARAAETNSPAAGTGIAARHKGPSVVRVASSLLVYTDGSREAVFSGGVAVEDADGSMKAQKATVYLQAAKAAKEPGKPGIEAAAVKKGQETFLGGNVDHVVAVGKVEIDQPGRHGTGEQMVYTASDAMFVLTGAPGALPKMEDAEKGTVTGEAIRFHSGDDRVVVSGEGIEQGKGKPGGHVRTETRVKQ